MEKSQDKREWLDRGYMTIGEATAFLKAENPENRDWTIEELRVIQREYRRLFHATAGHCSLKMAYSAMNRAFARIEKRMGL